MNPSNKDELLFVANVLSRSNPIVREFPIVEANQALTHIQNRDLSLPTAGRRAINDGVLKSAHKEVTITAPMSLYEVHSQIDEEILMEFQKESNQLLIELTTVVEKLEIWTGPFPKKEYEEFALKIDRIMGAAKTIHMLAPTHPGLEAIGQVADVCKYVGYKGVDRAQPELIPIFAAFWAEVVDYVKELMDNIRNIEESKEVVNQMQKILVKRINWLMNKVTPQVGKEKLVTSLDIDELMATFGKA